MCKTNAAIIAMIIKQIIFNKAPNQKSLRRVRPSHVKAYCQNFLYALIIIISPIFLISYYIIYILFFKRFQNNSNL